MTAQSNIISDLSSMTKIPNKILNELVDKENLCIGSAINDAIIEGTDVAVLNIGIGTLSIEIATKQCKFVPSRELKSAIKRSIDNKVDPLEKEIEKAIIDKLIKIYSEVFGDDNDDIV